MCSYVLVGLGDVLDKGVPTGIRVHRYRYCRTTGLGTTVGACGATGWVRLSSESCVRMSTRDSKCEPECPASAFSSNPAEHQTRKAHACTPAHAELGPPAQVRRGRHGAEPGAGVQLLAREGDPSRRAGGMEGCRVCNLMG